MLPRFHLSCLRRAGGIIANHARTKSSFLLRLSSQSAASRALSTIPAKRKVLSSPERIQVRVFPAHIERMGSDGEQKADRSQIDDIEELHKNAVLQLSTTYIDPATGFTVFTELAHLRRGKCCGNMCRHCPYGWENVKATGDGEGAAAVTPPRREAKLKSGDVASARRLLAKLGTGAPITNASSTASPCFPSDEYTEETSNDTESCIPPKNNHSKQSCSTTSDAKVAGRGGRHGGKSTGKNVPYTRGGDSGTSQLFTGERRSKTDITFEAMGTVDELCCVVGTVHAELMSSTGDTNSKQYGKLSDWLLDVMSRLFDAGSHIAKPPKLKDDDASNSVNYEPTSEEQPKFLSDGVGGGFNAEYVERLEEWIDDMTDELPELTSFILPTGGRASAQLHVARTVCRRAERRTVGLVENGVCDPNILRYLNRLSDFFFTAARWTNYCENREEIQYRRHSPAAKQRNAVRVSLRKKDGGS